MVIYTLNIKMELLVNGLRFGQLMVNPIEYSMIYGSKGSMKPAKQRRGDPHLLI